MALIVQSHLTKRASPTFGPVTTRLVEYGIARLRNENNGNKGQIVEPLAFLSVMKWLETHETDNMDNNIRLRLADQSSRGDAFEQLVVLYLHRIMPMRSSNFMGPLLRGLVRMPGLLDVLTGMM